MKSCSRRRFLAQSTALTLGALGTRAIAASSSSKQPQMVIAAWKGPKARNAADVDKLAAKLTEKAIAELGGMSRFVKRGDVVWVKPNIAWDRKPELAANTNPQVVATLVRLCFEAGAKKVKVGDNTCHLATKSYASSGIAAAVKPLGAEVVYVDRRRFKEVSIKGERLKSLLIYPEMIECDVMINAAIAKHHVLAGLTMCMKNYMGVIEKRRQFHQAIPECLCDLTRYMLPRTPLFVLDCVRVLLRHGPTGGNPADVAQKLTLAAGVDPVAVDAFGAEVMGRKPEEIGSVAAGDKVELGTMHYRSLRLREVGVS